MTKNIRRTLCAAAAALSMTAAVGAQEDARQDEEDRALLAAFKRDCAPGPDSLTPAATAEAPAGVAGKDCGQLKLDAHEAVRRRLTAVYATGDAEAFREAVEELAGLLDAEERVRLELALSRPRRPAAKTGAQSLPAEREWDAAGLQDAVAEPGLGGLGRMFDNAGAGRTPFVLIGGMEAGPEDPKAPPTPQAEAGKERKTSALARFSSAKDIPWDDIVGLSPEKASAYRRLMGDLSGLNPGFGDALAKDRVGLVQVKDGQLTVALNTAKDGGYDPVQVVADRVGEGPKAHTRAFLVTKSSKFMLDFDAAGGAATMRRFDADRSASEGVNIYLPYRTLRREANGWRAAASEGAPVEGEKTNGGLAADSAKSAGWSALSAIGTAGKVIFAPAQSAVSGLQSLGMNCVKAAYAASDPDSLKTAWWEFQQNYTARQAALVDMFSNQGVSTPEGAQRAYEATMSRLSAPARGEMARFLDAKVRKQREEDPEGMLWRSTPVTEQERARFAAEFFGGQRLPAQDFKIGQEYLENGDKARGAAFYALGLGDSVGRMVLEGGGAHKYLAWLRPRVLSAAGAITAQEAETTTQVLNGMRAGRAVFPLPALQAAQLEKGVRVINRANAVESAAMMAPVAAGAVQSGLTMAEGLRDDDSRKTWNGVNGLAEHAAGLVGLRGALEYYLPKVPKGASAPAVPPPGIAASLLGRLRGAWEPEGRGSEAKAEMAREPAPAPAAKAGPLEPTPSAKALSRFRRGEALSEQEPSLVLGELERWVGLAEKWGAPEDVQRAEAELSEARRALGMDAEAQSQASSGGVGAAEASAVDPAIAAHRAARERAMVSILPASLSAFVEQPHVGEAIDSALARDHSSSMNPAVQSRLLAGEKPSRILLEMLEETLRIEAMRKDDAGDAGRIMRFQEMGAGRLAQHSPRNGEITHNSRYSLEPTVDHLPGTLHEFIHRLGFGELRAHALETILFGDVQARLKTAGLAAPGAVLQRHGRKLEAAFSGAEDLARMRHLVDVGYSEEALLRHPEDRLGYLNLKLNDEGVLPKALMSRFLDESLAVLMHQRGRLAGEPALAKKTAAIQAQIRALTKEMGLRPEPPTPAALRRYREFQERFAKGSDETMTPELGNTMRWQQRNPGFQGDEAALSPSAVKRSIGSLVQEFFALRAKGGGGKVDPAVPLSHLEEIGPLPASLPERGRRLAEFTKGYLGLEGEVAAQAPGTDPLSGEQVFLLMKGGAPAAVAKVYRSERAATAIVNELGAAEALGRLGPVRSRVVETRGAFLAGPGEMVQIMEAAPGRDLYAALRSIGRANGADARGRALGEARAEVSAVANAMGEVHRISRTGGVSPGVVAWDVNSAREMLGKLEGRISTDLHAELGRRIEGLGEAVLKTAVPGAATHGDAHPGNFFVGPAGVTMIDVETAMHSIDVAGRGVGNPAADVGRFVGAMRLNNASKGLHLTESELSALERSFIDGYSKESGVPAETLAADVDFYRLRLGLTALTKDAANSEHYEAALRSILAKMKEGE
ncbi:MAG: phosphotransferase [Elusimicrobia bacterium]|nr:phosphotransferase [Elusimicrobiota bacterium]